MTFLPSLKIHLLPEKQFREQIVCFSFLHLQCSRKGVLWCGIPWDAWAPILHQCSPPAFSVDPSVANHSHSIMWTTQTSEIAAYLAKVFPTAQDIKYKFKATEEEYFLNTLLCFLSTGVHNYDPLQECHQCKGQHELLLFMSTSDHFRALPELLSTSLLLAKIEFNLTSY